MLRELDKKAVNKLDVAAIIKATSKLNVSVEQKPPRERHVLKLTKPAVYHEWAKHIPDSYRRKQAEMAANNRHLNQQASEPVLQNNLSFKNLMEFNSQSGNIDVFENKKDSVNPIIRTPIDDHFDDDSIQRGGNEI
jgi:hypothetical protein